MFGSRVSSAHPSLKEKLKPAYWILNARTRPGTRCFLVMVTANAKVEGGHFRSSLYYTDRVDSAMRSCCNVCSVGAQPHVFTNWNEHAVHQQHLTTTSETFDISYHLIVEFRNEHDKAKTTTRRLCICRVPRVQRSRSRLHCRRTT